jgi:hypothetical protein
MPGFQNSKNIIPDLTRIRRLCSPFVSHSCQTFSISSFPVVLHPYFKLAYIKHAWGGPEEQEAECKAGNPFAKYWQDEAQKIGEQTASLFEI